MMDEATAALWAKDDWYAVEEVRYCARCRTRRCERQQGGTLPCPLTCPGCDGTRLREEHNVRGKPFLRCEQCGKDVDFRRREIRENALVLLESILVEQTVCHSGPYGASIDFHEGGRETALCRIERFHGGPCAFREALKEVLNE